MKKIIFLIIPLVVLGFLISVKPVLAAACPFGPGDDNGNGTCTATFYPDANPETTSVDGWAQRSSSADESWSTIRNNAVGSYGYPSSPVGYIQWIQSNTTANTWRGLNRSYFLFDTSDLPDDTVISEATLSIYGESKVDEGTAIAPSTNIYSGNPDSNTDLTAADYVYTKFGTTPYSTTIPYANWSITGYNDFVFNANGLAAISKIGISKFSGRNANYDVPNTTPSWSGAAFYNHGVKGYFSEQGTGYQPKLVVTYSLPISAPTVTTQAATNILTTSATGNGNITSTGGENATVRGFKYGLTQADTWSVSDSGSFGAGAYTKAITGLSPGTLYYIRAFAVNSAGTSYGSYVSFTTAAPPPCVNHNVFGYAWSENIGWISFSCKNQNNPGDYGVDINISTGNFSGYAWSENIGWIDFAPAGPYPASPNYSACLDFPGSGQTCDGLGTNKVGGWARALAYGGGWDGWIKLRGSNYGVDYTSQSGELSGWAWSDMVIGWISFKGVNYGVVTTAKLPPSVSTAGETWNHCSFEEKSIPTLNWNYSDGTQASYWIQIDNTSAGFPNPEVDTGEIQISSQSYAVTFYDLDWDTKYWWRVKAKDQQGVWSNWSNIDNFTTPEHAYPYPGFSWVPQEPSQQEVVVFTPDQTGLAYLWTITEGTGEYVDGTGSASQSPHIEFLTPDNKIKLVITDSDDYSCESAEEAITAELPLPEYHEAPPIIWLRKALTTLASLIDGLYPAPLLKKW